jgi:L-lactate dehydrogenase complex protein LldE
MVKHYYPLLLRDDARQRDRALSVSGKIYELTQFLVDVLKVKDLGASFRARAVFHDSCQVSRALGVTQQPRVLLSKVRGLELLEYGHPERCCGFGGSFSFQFPEISEAIVRDKAESIIQSGATHLISCEISCLMNIGGFLGKEGHHIEAVHIAEVLDSRRG